MHTTFNRDYLSSTLNGETKYVYVMELVYISVLETDAERYACSNHAIDTINIG